MSFEQDLYAYLLDQESITSIGNPAVGTRIYSTLPPNPTFPCLKVDVFSVKHGEVLVGSDGTADVRVQFDAFSREMAEAIAIREAVRLCIHGFRGTMGGSEVLSGNHNLDTKQDAAPKDATGQWLYRRISDFTLTVRETIPAF